MDAEIIIAIISGIGALTSLIAAIAAFKREEIKLRFERKSLEDKESDRRREVQVAVAEDTVGLYRRLTEQYQELNEKDKRLLQTITFVIRHLIVLDRTVTDLLSDMQSRLDSHAAESDNIDCPFYDVMAEYLLVRISGIEKVIRETMDEVDSLLLTEVTMPDDKGQG